MPTLDSSQASGCLVDEELELGEGKKKGKGGPKIVKEPVTEESVRATAKEHGHSTPEVAGAFARVTGAKALVLNHLSVKYSHIAVEPPLVGSEEGSDRRRWEMLREIERLTDLAWDKKGSVVAFDFLEVEVKRKREAEEVASD